MRSSWLHWARVDGWGRQGFALYLTVWLVSLQSFEDAFSAGGIHRGLIPGQQGVAYDHLHPQSHHPAWATPPFCFHKGLLPYLCHLSSSPFSPTVWSGSFWNLLSQVHVKYKEVGEPVVCLVPSTVGRFTPGNYQTRALVSFHSELVCQRVWLEGACRSFLLSLSLLCSFVLVTGATV